MTEERVGGSRERGACLPTVARCKLSRRQSDRHAYFPLEMRTRRVPFSLTSTPAVRRGTQAAIRSTLTWE